MKEIFGDGWCARVPAMVGRIVAKMHKLSWAMERMLE